MRKVAVFTGTRAEYGLLYWTLHELQKSQKIDLKLWVGGSHLVPSYGYTIQEIEDDGFHVDEKLDFMLASSSSSSVAKSLSLAIISATEIISRTNPDVILLLGDRYEALAVAQAAMICGVPLAHIHGGEVTEGAIDEAIRHSITKMSHIHFTATEQYRKRVIQLGEDPKFVFNFGAPGLENILRFDLLSKELVYDELKLFADKQYFLITYHPETLKVDRGESSLRNLLKTLLRFNNYHFVFTYPNADMASNKFIELLTNFKSAHPNSVTIVKSLGHLRYLSYLKFASVVIGNSSSGIIEAPSFKTPTVNIGSRQNGRQMASSVLVCQGSIDSIFSAIQSSVSENFQIVCASTVNPYEAGQTSKNIVSVLEKFDSSKILSKRFNDIQLKNF